jgi:hypothetical protein
MRLHPITIYCGANLMFDGTNSYTTISAYKTISTPRDAATINETPNFISTVGSSADFLKIDNTNITFIESGAVAIAGITTDYDNEVRAGNRFCRSN